MKKPLSELFKAKELKESSNYLLSQELEFEYSKSILNFAMAFIGGVVTLKTALAFDKPIEQGFTLAIGAAVLSAVMSFEAQQNIISDLRLGRETSPVRRWFRNIVSPLLLGIAIGSAVSYFGLTLS